MLDHVPLHTSISELTTLGSGVTRKKKRRCKNDLQKSNLKSFVSGGRTDAGVVFERIRRRWLRGQGVCSISYGFLLQRLSITWISTTSSFYAWSFYAILFLFYVFLFHGFSIVCLVFERIRRRWLRGQGANLQLVFLFHVCL